MLRGLAGFAALFILGWLGGFVWFVAEAIRPAGPIPKADGIVVLTGGAGRIGAALDLLDADRAQLMLISGVSEGVDLADLLRAAGRTFEPGYADRIALGHAATTTIGNALETASWARSNGLHSLIVVTAGYHMRRALAEIGTALPEATLIPDPVQPPAMIRPSLGTLKLLSSEYTKWLLVVFGLTGAAHLREFA
ncbi:YdcF family protein [Acetobacteraceae bacterium KSS8]|uniref:YdcF family protein n=1 Tax=Endosaccharibacter trunci TaxID=2812733 RepID=A0ABT1W772_9PROT|nr:YdcF family protein [Acetobacteraceae bacterium KSS8]